MIKVDISKSYGEKVVLDGFELTVGDGKITALLGVSGSGKTTVLNAICGTIDFQGTANAGGEVSCIFQSPRLAPWLTVSENLELVLRNSEKNKAVRRERVAAMLRTVELSDAANLYPHELSGGMEQRVAIARAFLYPSAALLMDEPWRGLDIGLKKRLTAEFLKLFEKQPRSAVMVTHDLDDALMIADRVAVLKNGKNAAEFEVSEKAHDLTDKESFALRERLFKQII